MQKIHASGPSCAKEILLRRPSSDTILILDQSAQPESAAWQMACDEVLLRSSTCALLRVYSWASPAWTFGYFQKLQTVQEALGNSGFSLMRRWTGGGMVDHTQDLPYSLILPSHHPWAHQTAKESYRLIHTALLKSLQAQKINASLQHGEPQTGAQCFQSPVTADVMLDGQKIAGAAQRRSRHGLLHQGSIQFPNGTLNGRALLQELGGALMSTVETTTLSTAAIEEICALAETKYGTSAWLELR
jgi:lipoate-protein ligase A